MNQTKNEWKRVVRALALAPVMLATMPLSAMAHTGVHYVGYGESFASGFVHPILGLDHLLAMIAIGLWAATLGGRALLMVPLAFAGMMIAGALLNAAGMTLPAAEQGIAVSLVVLGLLLCMLVNVPAYVAAVLVGAFAIFHGYAHGAEIPALSRPLLYGAGFISATLLLLSLGAAIGMIAQHSAPRLAVRLAGAAVAAFGAVAVISRLV